MRRSVSTSAFVGLLLLTGCGTQQAGTQQAGTTTAAAPPAQEQTAHVHTAAGQAATVGRAAAGAPSAAVALRSDLERMLGAHVLLADELVRARERADATDPQSKAASVAVAANRGQLAGAVTKLAGAPAGKAFATAWDAHVDALGAYADGHRTKDAAARTAARTRLLAAEGTLETSLATVVGGTVPRPALHAAVDEHYRHLLEHADAFAAGDAARAYTAQRTGFAHAIMLADVLARGIAKAKKLPSADLDAPSRTLQTALSRLLAEHMGLMVELMRAAHDRATDFDAAGAALNANTNELGGAIATLYGAPAGKQFLQIWADHVEGLVSYAGDVGAGQAAKAAQTKAQLAQYAPKLATFLATATQQRLPAIELSAALTEHDDDLRQQVDTYATGDQAGARTIASAGYDHMFMLSQTLATAIGDAVASRLPQGGAQTGGGGLAPR